MQYFVSDAFAVLFFRPLVSTESSSSIEGLDGSALD